MSQQTTAEQRPEAETQAYDSLGKFVLLYIGVPGLVVVVAVMLAQALQG